MWRRATSGKAVAELTVPTKPHGVWAYPCFSLPWAPEHRKLGCTMGGVGGAPGWPVACCLSQPAYSKAGSVACLVSTFHSEFVPTTSHSHGEVGEEVPGTSQGLWCMLCLFPHKTGLILQSVQKLVWVLGGSEAQGIWGDRLSSALPWPLSWTKALSFALVAAHR